MPTSPQLSGVLAKLRERFAATAGNTLATFRQLADQLHRTPGAVEVVASVRGEAHRVHGTAGSYGFTEASRLAALLELVAIRWVADESLDLARRAQVVRHFALRLGEALRSAPPAESPLPRRLWLVGLPDASLYALAIEALHRGEFVEASQPAEVAKLLECGQPTAVIAMAPLDLAIPHGIPVLVVDPGLIDAPALLDQVTRAATPLGLAGTAVLLVGAAAAVGDSLDGLLAREEMQAVSIAGAAEFGGALARHATTVALVDVDATGARALELLRELRGHPRAGDVPCILLGGEQGASARDEAFAAGASDWLPKPVVGAELARRVGRLIERWRQARVARGMRPSTGQPIA